MLKEIPKIENYKTFWEYQIDQLLAYHKKSQNGKSFLYMHAQSMDILLQNLYCNATTLFESKYQKKLSYPITLIALGSYGRNELFLHSNIDLMLLYSEKIQPDLIDPFIEIFTENVIYPLWNLQINVTKKFGTINNAIEAAKKNYKIKNAQLDARLICGSKNLFNLFQEAYEAYFFQNEFISHFINQILEEKQLRHKKFNNTLFLREPDIKFGLGGLRDYQVLFWVLRAKFKTTEMQVIAGKGLLNKDQINDLDKAYNFLIRVRNELHFQSKVSANLLNIEKQHSIATALGYTHSDACQRVKIFMSDFYKHTECIHNLIELFEQNFIYSTRHPQKKSWLPVRVSQNFPVSKKEIDGFIIYQDTLTFKSHNVFLENPVRLLRIFKHAQHYHAKLNKELKNLIKKSLHLITKEILHSKEFNNCLFAIFQPIGEVYQVLQLMHELNILEVFIPEFQGITHSVHNDSHHQYTVDIHILYTLSFLDDIFQNRNPQLKHYYKAIKKTSAPWLIYLMILLHDLGKTIDHNSSKESPVEIAKKVLDRLQLDPEQQAYTLFIIKNQGLMREFWKNHDINDMKTLEKFASLIQNPQLLHYLFVFTFCDAKGTALNFWNNHKETLHKQFWERLAFFFSKNECSIEVLAHLHQKKDQCSQLIEKQQAHITKCELSKTLNAYPDNYFLLNNFHEIELHFRLLKHFDTNSTFSISSDYNESLFPIIHWEDDFNQHLTVVTIITLNELHLLQKLAQTFSSSGLKILHVKLFTRTDNVSITSFYIIETKDNPFSQDHEKRTFLQNLNKIYLNKSQNIPYCPSKTNTIDIDPPKKYVLEQSLLPSIDIYHQHNLTQTIVEIRCHDQSNLLYKVGSVIAHQGFNIHFAKTSTEYETAISTFHITQNTQTSPTCLALLNLREHLNAKLLE